MENNQEKKAGNTKGERDGEHDIKENVEDREEDLDDTIENIEEFLTIESGEINNAMENYSEYDIIEMDAKLVNEGEDNAGDLCEEIDNRNCLIDLSCVETQQVVIKSALSREASGGSTDSKKNKKVTFHPSVGDSDQEYIAEYDYPEYDDDVYEADASEQHTGEEDNTMEYDDVEVSGSGTSYHDIKRAAALYALRRGGGWGEGEGDGEKADVGDHSDEETLVNDPNESFGEEYKMYPDEYVDEAGEIVDSEEEFIEHLEDVEVPPELEGIDPYLLASMLEEIQEQQDREGSPTAGSPKSNNAQNMTEFFQGFVDGFAIQILEGVAEDLYEHFQSKGGILDESVKETQEVPGLEMIPEVDSAEDQDDTDIDDNSFRERINSSGFIEKQSLVENLQAIINELGDAEKPPSESSVESGALSLDDDPSDTEPRESFPIPSSERQGQKKVNLFQAMKQKAHFSFGIAGSGQSLFEGDLFRADDNTGDVDLSKEYTDINTKNELEVSIDYNSSGIEASEHYEIIGDINSTVIEVKPKDETNEVDYLKQLEIMENISASADKLSKQILDSVMAIWTISSRKKSIGVDDDSAPSPSSPNKVAKLDLSGEEQLLKATRKILSQSEGKEDSLDEIDLTIQEKIKTRKRFDKSPHRKKAKFPHKSNEANKAQESHQVEYTPVNEGILFGSDKFEFRSANKSVMQRNYTKFTTDQNGNTGHLAAPVMYEQYLISRANWYQRDLNQSLSDSRNAAEAEETQVDPESSGDLEHFDSNGPESSKAFQNVASKEANERRDIGIDEVDLTVREKVKTRKKFSKSVLKVNLC